MLKRIATVAAAAALAGCANLPEVVTISSPFDAAAAEKMMAPGSNTLKVNAFMRQQGGGVVTCAGNQVHLAPATAYADERVRAIYGTFSDVGFVAYRQVTFQPDEAAYRFHQRQATCDAQGVAVFEGVADGQFYLVTNVSWMAGYARQGGNLVRKVDLRGGQTVTAILSR